MFKNKIVLIVLGVLPLLIVTALTVVILGVKKYGTPATYKAMQLERAQARMDSLDALKDIALPENLADSTLIGISAYSNIVDETDRKKEELANIQASIDSLKALRAELEQQEQDIQEREESLEEGRAMLQDENAEKLAKLYDTMKVRMAVPLFIEMNDTLAVKILSRMREKAAGRILGSIAETDVNKATRLNKLMSMEEVAQ